MHITINRLLLCIIHVWNKVEKERRNAVPDDVINHRPVLHAHEPVVGRVFSIGPVLFRNLSVQKPIWSRRHKITRVEIQHSKLIYRLTWRRLKTLLQ